MFLAICVLSSYTQNILAFIMQIKKKINTIEMFNHLLTSTQMASFIADGYIRFDNIVPLSLCKMCLKEIPKFNGYLSVGMPFEKIWPNKFPTLGCAVQF